MQPKDYKPFNPCNDAITSKRYETNDDIIEHIRFISRDMIVFDVLTPSGERFWRRVKLTINSEGKIE